MINGVTVIIGEDHVRKQSRKLQLTLNKTKLRQIEERLTIHNNPRSSRQENSEKNSSFVGIDSTSDPEHHLFAIFPNAT